MKYFFDNNIAKYGIKELKDGLTIEIIAKKFPWILDTKISNAVLGIRHNNRLIWYSGVWKNLLWHLIKWYFSYWGFGVVSLKKWNLCRRSFSGKKYNIWENGIYLDFIFQNFIVKKMKNEDLIKEIEKNYNIKVPTFWSGFCNIFGIKSKIKTTKIDDKKSLQNDWKIIINDFNKIFK